MYDTILFDENMMKEVKGMSKRIVVAIYVKKSKNKNFNMKQIEICKRKAFMDLKRDDTEIHFVIYIDDLHITNGRTKTIKQIMEHINEGQIQCIYLPTLDIFCRNVALLLDLIKASHNKGIPLISAAEDYNSTSQFGQFFTDILNAFWMLEIE